MAEMAGLPQAVIHRAREILHEHSQVENKNSPQVSLETKHQMDLFFEKETALANELQEIDIYDMTPLEVLSKLDKLKKKHGI